MITIYKIKNTTNEIELYEDCRVNSFAGSFLFWHQMEEKYLTEERYSRVLDLKRAHEIWDLVDDERLDIMERIIMACTFDFCIIKKEYFDCIINCFLSPFATEAMIPVADCLRKLESEDMDDCLGICLSWNSVSDPYGVYYDNDDEEHCPKITDDFPSINNETKKMWFLFEDENFEELLKEYEKLKRTGKDKR